MCGITGIWNLDSSKIDLNYLNNFNNSLKHRGPDGCGTFVDRKEGLGLGHRRLSILDLSTNGKQPMSYLEERFWITYNGEIYNFLEIQKELKKLGHKFFSDTDTEIILASYVEWGEKCQEKFNGMWAFAIWDSKEKNIFLSRDRFGVKPLFYIHTKNHFIFASELKAFISLPNGIRPKIDKGMISLMANIENCETTILKNVKNLYGGHQLRIKKGGDPIVEKWWDTSKHIKENNLNEKDQIEEFKDIFTDACKIRMRSDVSIGTSLSGGLDSSSVLATMSYINTLKNFDNRASKNWNKAFCLDYKDTGYSERQFAEIVANHTKFSIYNKEINLSKISEKDLISSTISFEAIQEPSIGPWYIYQKMRNENVVVSLDGHGGDELLAGYENYPLKAMNDHYLPWNNTGTFEQLQKIIIDFEQGNYVPSRYDIFKRKYFDFNNMINETIKIIKKRPKSYHLLRKIYRLLLRKNQINEFDRPQESSYLKEEIPNFRHFDNLNKALYFDFHYGTLPRILRNVDRLSMAHGVEVRAPFLDWRIVVYCFSLLSNMKIKNGFTKYILRESMKGLLPESIRNRRAKIGFASPMSEWYRTSLKEFVLDCISSKNFLESDIWNGYEIKNFVENQFKLHNYQKASTSWKFIQAMILINEFEK